MRDSINAHLESLKVRHYAAGSVQRVLDGLKVFERYLALRGIGDLREVTRAVIADYQGWLLDQSYSVTTRQGHLSSLRGFFARLVAIDAVFLNPCEGLVLPRRPDRLPRNILTPDEVRRILNAPDTQTPKGIRDRAILEVFYSTGLRAREMWALTVHDVDWRNGFVRVNKGKFSKDRVVPMGRKACDYVREYLQKIRAEWARVARQAGRDERALWLSSRRRHQPMTQQAIALVPRDAARLAGVNKTARPHVWRHTCATHMVANGSNIVYVQRLLGHRSLETTQVYTRVAVPELKATHRKKHPRS
jgi:integrase/recombinase XerD